MKVIAYTTAQDVPEAFRAVAVIENDGGFHPIIFTGTSVDIVTEKAQTWWDAEIAKARTKVENSAKRVAARKAATVPAVVQTPPDPLGDVL